MLATVRRGPFAKPTALEQIEYLFTRVPAKESRKDFEKHPLEHVLSFQRRVLACKKFFLARGKDTTGHSPGLLGPNGSAATRQLACSHPGLV